MVTVHWRRYRSASFILSSRTTPSVSNSSQRLSGLLTAACGFLSMGDLSTP
jgi:hypothetical protein